jgi:hypothetical protein
MPKMQEQFSAGAYTHTIPKNEDRVLAMPGMPKMQQHFPRAP